jgi:hypothetical protein
VLPGLGLQRARHQYARGNVITEAVEFNHGAILGRSMLGTTMLGALPPHRWMPLETISAYAKAPRYPTRGQALDSQVAGQPVVQSLAVELDRLPQATELFRTVGPQDGWFVVRLVLAAARTTRSRAPADSSHLRCRPREQRPRSYANVTLPCMKPSRFIAAPQPADPLPQGSMQRQSYTPPAPVWKVNVVRERGAIGTLRPSLAIVKV